MRLIDGDALTIHFKRAIGTFLPNDPTRHMKTEDALICKGWQDGLMVIQDAPTIKTKKGKWIHHSIGHMNAPWGYDCSVCGAWFVINDDASKRYNFCPNCGAEMEK